MTWVQMASLFLVAWLALCLVLMIEASPVPPPQDGDAYGFIDVEIAICVTDMRAAKLEQDRGIKVMASGIDQPANPIAASVMWSRDAARADAGDGAKTEIVRIKFPKSSINHGKGAR